MTTTPLPGADEGASATSEDAKQPSVSKSLTLAQELRAAISGVIFGSIELKFAHFLDHDDHHRQYIAEEHLETLLAHLDSKFTELTDLVATDKEPK